MFKPICAICILIGSLSAPTFAWAKGELKILDKATAFARAQKVVRLNVEKKVVSELLGKETLSPGEIHVRQNRFRWEVEKPEKSLLIFDGKILWVAAYPPAGFDDPVQVTKTKLGKNREDQILLRLLTGAIVPSKSFELVSKETAGKTEIFSLKTKSTDEAVKDLKVEVTEGALSGLSYRDDVDNLTQFRILENAPAKNPTKSLFKFQVPKGAEVQEL